MSYSCTDFTDDVLNELVRMKLIRDEDLPPDDPEAQAQIVLRSLQRVKKIIALSGEAASMLLDAEDREELTASQIRTVSRPMRVTLRGLVPASWAKVPAKRRAARSGT